MPPTADTLRAAFDATEPYTVGLEEELMLLDPDTLDLAPRAPEVLALVAGDDRFKLELPAAQVEIVTPPGPTIGEAAAAMLAARGDLAAAVGDRVRLAGAGAHPFASPVGELNAGERYRALAAEYGSILGRQLLFGLHVHVGLGNAERALAVHDALRSFLPDLAALAAGAPFHDGRDTGLASIRPKLADVLPRQGLPPALHSWEAFAAELRWGAASGAVGEPRQWWWEARLHPAFGTLEVRVPDTQATVAENAAVAAVAHALVVWLAERHAAGETLSVAEGWRIAENRWSACRHGLDGSMADLVTGRRVPTRERLHALLGELEPVAARLGCAAELARATTMAQDGVAPAHRRAIAAERGLVGLVAWLAGVFLDGA